MNGPCGCPGLSITPEKDSRPRWMKERALERDGLHRSVCFIFAHHGFKSVAEIQAHEDACLLMLQGVGPAKVRRVRSWRPKWAAIPSETWIPCP